MRISDWSSDVCSSDLSPGLFRVTGRAKAGDVAQLESEFRRLSHRDLVMHLQPATRAAVGAFESVAPLRLQAQRGPSGIAIDAVAVPHTHVADLAFEAGRSEEQQSELQSLMRITYAGL